MPSTVLFVLHPTAFLEKSAGLGGLIEDGIGLAKGIPNLFRGAGAVAKAAPAVENAAAELGSVAKAVPRSLPWPAPGSTQAAPMAGAAGAAAAPGFLGKYVRPLVDNKLTRMALPAAVGYGGYGLGHVKGQFDGETDGAAQVLNYQQQHPWQTAGYGVASLFGQGTNALESAITSRLRDSSLSIPMRLGLPQVLAKVKAMQLPTPPPGAPPSPPPGTSTASPLTTALVASKPAAPPPPHP